MAELFSTAHAVRCYGCASRAIAIVACGAFGVVKLYAVETHEITRVAAPDMGDMFVSQDSGMDWIGDKRLIV